MDDRERRPLGREWTEISTEGLPRNPGVRAKSAWRSGPIQVISTLNFADLPDGSGVGPQWHVSISATAKRPKPHHVRRALRAFGMVGAEEDNHHPGNARHFWQPCDPAHRVDCQCKADEVNVVDADGYRWTNPHEDGSCRGCEFARVVGKPCPIHSQLEAVP